MRQEISGDVPFFDYQFQDMVKGQSFHFNVSVPFDVQNNVISYGSSLSDVLSSIYDFNRNVSFLVKMYKRPYAFGTTRLRPMALGCDKTCHGEQSCCEIYRIDLMKTAKMTYSCLLRQTYFSFQLGEKSLRIVEPTRQKVLVVTIVLLSNQYNKCLQIKN